MKQYIISILEKEKDSLVEQIKVIELAINEDRCLFVNPINQINALEQKILAINSAIEKFA